MHKPAITHNEIVNSLKALQTRLFNSLYRLHCTETLECRCYNNGSNCFSFSDYNNFIVCDRSL